MSRRASAAGSSIDEHRAAGLLCAETEPPCARTTSRTMASPSPALPSGLVVTHGSNRRSSDLRRHPGRCRRLRVGRRRACAAADRQRAAAGHRVEGVGDEVEQRHLELRGVGVDARAGSCGNGGLQVECSHAPGAAARPRARARSCPRAPPSRSPEGCARDRASSRSTRVTC